MKIDTVKIIEEHKLWIESKGRQGARAILADANLIGVNLTGADLTRANLAGAYLKGANLMDADLAGADLAGADLTRADLAGANLVGANLKGAYLEGAYLEGANLRGTILEGIIITEKTELTKDYLDGELLKLDVDIAELKAKYTELRARGFAIADLRAKKAMINEEILTVETKKWIDNLNNSYCLMYGTKK